MIKLSRAGGVGNANFSPIIYIIFALTLLVSPGLSKRVDFDTCYANNVTKLNNKNTSDHLQCFKWDPTHTNRTHTNQTFLSLDGCYTLCGHGFQFYSTSDIVFRLTLFVVPLISLAGRVGFAPVSIANMFWTIVHLLGDPIDSMWSTLTRQEKARRNYHVGLEIAPGAAREVAAVWTAYDQWWQDPVRLFEEKLKKEEPLSRSRIPNERYQAKRSETTVDLDRHDQVKGDRQMNVNVPELLTNKEKFYIKQAARDLANNRTNHPITSWIAIVIFVCALTAGYVHLGTSHTTNDVSHALAVMTLFFFLPFAVYITGHVGNFRQPEQCIATVFKIHDKYPKLFPAPQLLQDKNAAPRNLSRQEFSAEYELIQSFAGINSSWRPRKHLASRNASSDRGQVLLWFQSFSVVIISWLAAFLLSYMTPVWGLGCRSGSWTVITVAWLISALIDFVSQWISVDILGEKGAEGQTYLTKQTAQALWWGSMIKDLFITISILILVGLSQVGYFNTCWCMASMFFRPKSKMDSICIDLGPIQQEDRDSDWIRWLVIPIVTLIVIHSIIFWAGWEGEGGRLLYLRTNTERHAEDIALENMQQRLYIVSDDSDQEDQPRQTRQDVGHTSIASSESESSPRRGYAMRTGYNTLSTEEHELQNLAESSGLNRGLTPPRPSLSPRRHTGSQERESLRVPLDSITTISESHSATSLLPH